MQNNANRVPLLSIMLEEMREGIQQRRPDILNGRLPNNYPNYIDNAEQLNGMPEFLRQQLADVLDVHFRSKRRNG